MNWKRSDPSAKLRSQDHISTSSKLSRAQFVLLNSNISIWEFWIMHQHITNPFCLQPAVQSKQYFANVLQIVFWIWSMNLFWLAWWNRRLPQRVLEERLELKDLFMLSTAAGGCKRLADENVLLIGNTRFQTARCRYLLCMVLTFNNAWDFLLQVGVKYQCQKLFYIIWKQKWRTLNKLPKAWEDQDE